MSFQRLAFATTVLLGASLASQAHAESPALAIEYQTEMGTYGQHEYVYVEGTMSGTVTRADNTTGTYKVPFVLAYPKDGGNQLAYVDLPEVSWFILWRTSNGEVVACGRGMWNLEFMGPPPCDEGDTDGSRLEAQVVTNGIKAAEGYLFREGYTYFSVQYAKMVTEAMGPETPDGTTRRRLVYGTIERGADGDEILKDASRILRQPNLQGVAPSTHVLMYAFSAAGIRATGFLADGQNVGPNGELFYEGFIITNNGALGWINSEEPPIYAGVDFFGPPATNGAKVIRIDMEADLLGSGGVFARDPNHGTPMQDPDHVRWEVAGVAHLTPLIDDLSHMGATRQNPIDRFPIDRAAMAHLAAWVVNGTEPPPSAFVEGTVDEMGNFTPTVDADGNSLGGVRLPHMPRANEAAGAPTGVYGGAETMVNNLYVFLGGTYDPFSEARLQELYPTDADYRMLFNRGAELARDEGYILQEDYERYIAPRPEPPPPPDEELPPEDGGCCSADRGSPPLASLFLFLGLWQLGRASLRRRRGQ